MARSPSLTKKALPTLQKANSEVPGSFTEDGTTASTFAEFYDEATSAAPVGDTGGPDTVGIEPAATPGVELVVTTESEIRDALGAGSFSRGLGGEADAEPRLTFEQRLGVFHDALSFAKWGSELGFGIAGRATETGFGIATTITDKLRLKPVTGAINFAQSITTFSQGFARKITRGSIQAAQYGTDLCGAERGTGMLSGLGMQIGDDEANACFAVLEAAGEIEKAMKAAEKRKYSGTEQTMNIFAPEKAFGDDLQIMSQGLYKIVSQHGGNVASDPELRSLRPSSSVPMLQALHPHLVRSFPLFHRLLGVCAALYGKLFNHFVGTYRELWRGSEADFFKLVMEKQGFQLEYHRDELNIPEEGMDGSRVDGKETETQGTSAASYSGAASSSGATETADDHDASLSTKVKRSRVYYPAHALLADHSKKQIIVAIRGTASIRDALTDLVCQPYKVPLEEQRELGLARAVTTDTVSVSSPADHPLRVHHGMWKAANILSDELTPRILALLDQVGPEYSLVVTGHSLGAGTATLLGFLWRNSVHGQKSAGEIIRKLSENGVEGKKRITVLGFATPQTLDVAHARREGAEVELDSTVTLDSSGPHSSELHYSGSISVKLPTGGTISLVLGDDMVPRFSLRSTLDLVHKAMELGQENADAGAEMDTTNTTTPSSWPPHTLNVPGLGPPGRIVHLKPRIVNGDRVDDALETDQEGLEGIQISKSMLMDHMWVEMLQELETYIRET